MLGLNVTCVNKSDPNCHIFWNFAHSMEVSLFYSVQNFKAIWQLWNDSWANEVYLIN